MVRIVRLSAKLRLSDSLLDTIFVGMYTVLYRENDLSTFFLNFSLPAHRAEVADKGRADSFVQGIDLFLGQRPLGGLVD